MGKWLQTVNAAGMAIYKYLTDAMNVAKLGGRGGGAG
jgi:hypothetical protein